MRAAGFDIQLPDAQAPLQLLLFLGEAEIDEADEYFWDRPITPEITLPDLIDGGGVLVTQRDTIGIDAAAVHAEIGDRATIIDLGPYDAALVWADPIFEGARRSYDVYWSDGTYDWSVIAGTNTPEDAVRIAQSLYCG